MFSLFKKKIPKTLSAFSRLTADIHSHILPGIDDGSPDTRTSIELIKGLKSLGFTKLKGTPHIIGDMYRNSSETIFPALEKLKNACQENEIEIELSAAAEYMIDDYFLELLRKKQQLLPIHDNIILTEIPYNSTINNLDEITFEIFTAGYIPILAHPERYNNYHKNFKEFASLKDAGFLLQVNLLSFTGYYGKAAQKAAYYIMEKGLADHVGTDIHHFRHLETFKQNISLIDEAIGKREYNIF